MSLADQIIEHGPWKPGDSVRELLGNIPDCHKLNELRDELIAARALKELLAGYEVFGLGDDEFGAVVLKCLHCTDWQVETDTTSDTLVLAELVQRATQHAEVCR